jgi:recombination protein RecR
MHDKIEELSAAFARFPGIGPRQAKRFVFYLLSAPAGERSKLSELVASIAGSVTQCVECRRFWSGSGTVCNYCADRSRDDPLLMIVEKDQDLSAVERAGAYRGRYFVLGGTLTLSGKGAIRERELVEAVKMRQGRGLTEIVLALSATSEGEHTADRVRELLRPFRESVRITALGRGLSTGSELEYADRETLSGALAHRTDA